jgi:hypothetical protein
VKANNKHLVELYRCPVHGFVEMGKEIEGKGFCLVSLGRDETCLFKLSGPFPAVVDLAPPPTQGAA